MIPAPRLFSEAKWELSHGGSLFNNSFLALNLDWPLPQNHFYEAGGTETATPGYLLVGASAGTDIVIKDKSRLKYIGVYNMGRNVTFKLVVPF